MAETRKNLMVGNWKMNTTHLEAIQMAQKLSYLLENADYQRVEVVIAPPFTALRSVQLVIEADRLPFGLASQNVFWEEKGAFTGEISPQMLVKLAVTYVICGHSERRQYFGETDLTVNKRVKACFSAGLEPIVCVGETLEQREAGQTEAVVVTQLRGALAGIQAGTTLVIAYEPVWAIGTGRTATADDAGSVCELIRNQLDESLGGGASAQTRILYGGSVNAANIKALMAKRHIDGALVGGASLDPESFAAICRYWV